MAYVVDRVVICDAFREPDKHYQLLAGGKSKLVQGRRSSVRFLASAKDVKGGIAGVVGKEASLFEDMLASSEQQNDFVNQLRDEVRGWREAGYPGTALVTRRLLEWWFERDEERRAIGRRFFFCQQEATETVIYLYEVQKRRKMPETGDLVRYALKLATGTGKTVVMAMLVTWSTLHKRKVSGSSLSANFLVLVPNLTVRDRVSGVPRGDGLSHSGEHNLYDAFDTVPPEYHDEFHPNVVVRNWQGIPLDGKRDDWIPEEVAEEGRFIPAAVRSSWPNALRRLVISLLPHDSKFLYDSLSPRGEKSMADHRRMDRTRRGVLSGTGRFAALDFERADAEPTSACAHGGRGAACSPLGIGNPRWGVTSGRARSDRWSSDSAHAEEAAKRPSQGMCPLRCLRAGQRQRTLCDLMLQGVDDSARRLCGLSGEHARDACRCAVTVSAADTRPAACETP